MNTHNSFICIQNPHYTFIFIILLTEIKDVKTPKSSNIAIFLEDIKIEYLEINSLECVRFSLYFWSDLHLLSVLY